MIRTIILVTLLVLVLQFSLHAGEKFDLLMEAHKMLKKGEINRNQYNSLRQKILFDSGVSNIGRDNVTYKIKHLDGKKHIGIVDVTVHFNFVVGPKSYSIGKSIMVMDGKLKKLGTLKYRHHSSRNIMVYTGRLNLVPGEYRSLGFNYIVGDDIKSLYFYNFVYYKTLAVNDGEIKKLNIRYDIADKSAIIDRDIRTSIRHKDPGFTNDPLNAKYENEYEKERKHHFRWKL